jgi:hypothetical protein
VRGFTGAGHFDTSGQARLPGVAAIVEGLPSSGQLDVRESIMGPAVISIGGARRAGPWHMGHGHP